jgi:hypothetical protein
VTGEHLDKLCVRRLRGAWRAVVAFHPDENVVWIVLVGEHADDDPGRDVYDLLYEIVAIDRQWISGGANRRAARTTASRRTRPSRWLSFSRRARATSCAASGHMNWHATTSGRSSVEVR